MRYPPHQNEDSQCTLKSALTLQKSQIRRHPDCCGKIHQMLLLYPSPDR